MTISDARKLIHPAHVGWNEEDNKRLPVWCQPLRRWIFPDEKDEKVIENVRMTGQEKKKEDELVRLAQKHGVLRMSASPEFTTEEAVAFLRVQGAMFERCGLPKHMEHLLK